MMKQNLRFIFLTLLCAVFSTAWGSTYHLQQVTSVEAGGLYVFEQDGYVMNNTVSSSALQTTNSYLTEELQGTETYVWTLEAANGGFYFKNVSLSSNQYLNNTSSTNVSFGNKNSIWVFNFQTDDNTMLIQNISNSDRFLGFKDATSHAYKAYATGNLSSYPHAIKVFQLVEDENPNSVAKPTFNPVGGTYTTAQDVTISCDTEGATIYYTTDGTVPPIEESYRYSTKVSITRTGTTLNAIAVMEGMANSYMESATYYIEPNAPGITASETNVVTITAGNGLTIYYTTDGTTPTNTSTQYTDPFTPERSCTVKAIAYDTYGNASTVAELVVTLPVTPRPKNINSNYYVKVTSANDLQDGDAILIVNEANNVAMSTQTTNNRASTYVTLSSDGIFVTSSDVQKIILVGATGAWYFCVDDEDNPAYLYAASSSSNYLRTTEEEDLDNNAKATISISSGNATIQFQGSNTRNLLKYNSSNDIFSCYASGQSAVQIYKEVPAPTIPVNISEVGYATLYYGTKHLKVPEGVVAYTCKANADLSITHTTTFTFEEGDVIPAGTAVLLQGAEGNYSFTESANAGNKTVGENMLRGYDTEQETKGPNEVTDGYKFFVLSLNAAGETSSVGFYYKVANGAAFLSGAHKAFLAVPNEIAEASSYVFDDQTGISNMKMTTNKEGVYTLSGVRVQSDNLPAGLYIVNGKKMVIK